jgi:hypothetical protein
VVSSPLAYADPLHVVAVSVAERLRVKALVVV